MTTDTTGEAITRATIQHEYEAAMFACARIMPIRSWAVTPIRLELEAHRKAYGRASSQGVILINQLFIGSHEIDTLRKVLRHELAHLAAGLSYQHNSRRFKIINGAFGGVTSTTLDSTLIKDSRSGKYRLWAITDKGARRRPGPNDKKASSADQLQSTKEVLIDERRRPC